MEIPEHATDSLAFRLAEIIASMKSNNGTPAIWILQLEEALDIYDADYDEYMVEVLVDEGIGIDEA
jgi:hypothetical protein|tara:strand:+ start:398 stop:595 length:198 start_codon:yes stop_codon:yes gene_type:complete